MNSGTPTWPPATAAAYRAAGLWVGETFDAFLRARVAEFADRAATVGGDGERWTYRDLDSSVGAAASHFAGLGVGPRQRVVVQMPNTPAFLSVLFGLWRVGAVPVMALPAHRRSELVNVARRAAATAIVTVERWAGVDHGDHARAVAEQVASVRAVVCADDMAPSGRPVTPTPTPASDVALVQLSGGTTGAPKLIPRTPDDYLYSVRRSARICRLDRDTVYLCVLPAAHNFPMSSPGLLGVLHAGGTVVFAPTPDPHACFALVERERVTMTALVPPLAQAWLDAAERERPDLSSLDLVQVGGARLAPSTARRITPLLGARLQQVFGMAEGLVCYTRLDDPDELVALTQGRPMSEEDEVRIVGPDGLPVAEGETGQLETRGPYTVRGYEGGEARGAFTDDGFYRTGDLVRRLPSGHLVVEGRAGDRINRGGEMVGPDEVEDHLRAHPSVRDALVVGLPDPRLGECVYAVVVARPERVPTPAELRRFMRERSVAAYLLPDRIEVVERLPLTGVGKASRSELRRRLAERVAVGGAVA